MTEFSCVLMISIHAPAKGATISCPSKVLFCNISIHAPAKGATIVPVIQSNPNTFQSTLPRRERRICYLLHCRRSDFNPRSREGSDLSQSKQSIQRYLFQSTLPRRERRSWMRSQIRVCIISIHAPAKGATQIIWNYWKIYSISIHAPAKGATFLFRYRALGDAISIHAPAKGATHQQRYVVTQLSYFNPRSREGSDSDTDSIHMLDDDFNPRSREGSDKDVNRLETLITISIHAPAKGATFTGSPLNVLSTDFNPRSREGSDCQRLVRRSKQKNFNPRSR